jgi:LmbE family N-acetylglucosaminyl deacetylase
MIQMKIVIFEPHPDDLLFGPGPKIFDWKKEKHEIHVITITDGRACYREREGVEMAEDEVAKMRLKEARQAIKFLGLPEGNHHLLKFHDADGQKYVDEAIEKVKPLIKDADRLVLPSDHNGHVDHQATHDIATRAAKQLSLEAEFWVYFIPSYGRFDEDSAEKQVEKTISDSLREKLQEWLQIYQSQKKTPLTWKFYNRYLKRVRKAKYGIFELKDLGKYHNF